MPAVPPDMTAGAAPQPDPAHEEYAAKAYPAAISLPVPAARSPPPPAYSCSWNYPQGLQPPTARGRPARQPRNIHGLSSDPMAHGTSGCDAMCCPGHKMARTHLGLPARRRPALAVTMSSQSMQQMWTNLQHDGPDQLGRLQPCHHSPCSKCGLTSNMMARISSAAARPYGRRTRRRWVGPSRRGRLGRGRASPHVTRVLPFCCTPPPPSAGGSIGMERGDVSRVTVWSMASLHVTRVLPFCCIPLCLW